MTASIVEALEKIQASRSSLIEKNIQQLRQYTPRDGESTIDQEKDQEKGQKDFTHEAKFATETKTPAGLKTGNVGEKSVDQNEKTEPVLSSPSIGNPISHGQIMDISKEMKSHRLKPDSLEILLRGSRVYVAPPKPRPEPTSEYKALMARLRREEEARSYERMTNPPPPMETFNRRFPAASAAHAFSSSHQAIGASDPDDDGLTFADVDRQMALILNVLLSIVACAAAIWIAAKWWSTPARLALSMSGGMLVGVAEVVVYSGYIRRLGEAKGKERAVKEVKEVVNTWVVGAGQDNDTAGDVEDSSVMIESKKDDKEGIARKRRKDNIL